MQAHTLVILVISIILGMICGVLVYRFYLRWESSQRFGRLPRLKGDSGEVREAKACRIELIERIDRALSSLSAEEQMIFLPYIHQIIQSGDSAPWWKNLYEQSLEMTDVEVLSSFERIGNNIRNSS